MQGFHFTRFWRGFWQLADPKIWIASTVPMAIGAAMAYSFHGTFNLYWFLVTVAGIYAVEIGKNAVNEYVDYQSGADRFVTPDKRTPFSGGKKTIVDGLLTLKEAAFIAVATMILGAVVGLYIVFAREPAVLWVGLAGFFFALFYSLPPARFAYKGLGEFVVGLTFGPLIMVGAYLVQAHTVNVPVVVASLPVGFLIANVLLINQYPDMEADARALKRNWVVRLGRKRGIRVFIVLYFCVYASLLVLWLVTGNPFWPIAFLSLPVALRAIRVAREHYDDIPRLMEANARTIQVYQLLGVAMVAAALLGKAI